MKEANSVLFSGRGLYGKRKSGGNVRLAEVKILKGVLVGRAHNVSKTFVPIDVKTLQEGNGQRVRV